MSDATIRLSEIQKSLKAPKGQRNSFGNYNYRSLEDIMEAIKPLLKEDEFVTLSDDIVMVGDRFYVKATACFQKGNNLLTVHAFARESLDKKGMDSAQITGATSSYARKYACNGLFAIDDTKDADSQDNSHNETKHPEPIETGYDTGVRVPANYWKYKDAGDMDAAQELLGVGFYPKKTDKGWFIFSKEKVVEALPSEPPKVLIGAPELKKTAPEASKQGEIFISIDQRAELHKVAKERGVHHLTFKKYLKDNFGIEETTKIHVSDYLTIYDYLKTFESAGVGQ